MEPTSELDITPITLPPSKPIDKKLISLTLRDKVKAITMVTVEKMTIKEVTAHFKCGKSQIYNIIKQKDKIMTKYLLGNKNDLAKRKERETKYSRLNRIVLEWFSEAKAKKYPISGPILQGKAKEMAGILNLDGFAASNGWLQSFRKRHGITFNVSGGEASETEKTSVESWPDKLREITCHYNPKDIANADEIALFFRALPHETLQMKGEKCSRGRYSQERLTVLLVAFADGKLEKPLVIGKSENPRCFKNLKKSQLPVDWMANKDAWMTSAIFEEFLKKFNKRMENENRKIVLFLDDANCHPRIQLSNIRLIFLPPYITSFVQPLENGITHNVKLNYRKLMLEHLIANMDLTVKIDVLDAITFLSRSVKGVNDECIRNCFRNCGLLINAVGCNITCNNSNSSEIQHLIEEMYENEVCVVNAESYVKIDEHVLTAIDVQNVIGSETNDDLPTSDDEMSGEDCEQMETPTLSQVISYINALKYYAKMNGENNFYDKVADLEFSFNSMKKS